MHTRHIKLNSLASEECLCTVSRVTSVALVVFLSYGGGYSSSLDGIISFWVEGKCALVVCAMGKSDGARGLGRRKEGRKKDGIPRSGDALPPSGVRLFSGQPYRRRELHISSIIHQLPGHLVSINSIVEYKTLILV